MLHNSNSQNTFFSESIQNSVIPIFRGSFIVFGKQCCYIIPDRICDILYFMLEFLCMSQERKRLIGVDVSGIIGNLTGVEYYILSLYKALRRNTEVEIIPFSNHKIPEIPETIIGSSRLPLVIWRQIHLPFLLKKYAVNSLHSPVTAFPFFSPCPRVVTIHDLGYKIIPESYEFRDVCIQNFWSGIAMRSADAVIAVSQTTRKQILKFFPERNQKVYPVLSGAIANEHSEMNEISASAVLQQLKIRRPYLLQVGRIDIRKNPLMTLNGFKKSGLEEYSLVFAGSSGNASGDVEGWLAVNPEMRSKIIFTGYLSPEKIQVLMKLASVMVYPSLDEGFGHPPLEALQENTLSIVSDIPVLREVLGDAVLFVPLDDSSALAEAMRRMIADSGLRERLLLSGKKRLRFLNWQKTASEIIQIHRNLWAKEC